MTIKEWVQTPRFKHLAARAQALRRKHRQQGWISVQSLVRVSLKEAAALHRYFPETAKYVRTWESVRSPYEKGVYLPDFDQPSLAQRAFVKELWVGARSLASGAEENDDSDLPSGFRKGTEEQEDQAELTDLVTFLYTDEEAFQAWVDKRALQLLKQARPAKKWHNNRILRAHYRAWVLRNEVAHDRNGEPVPAMIEDPETGETRPIRYGDSVEIVRTSNDDLDALFLDEADDPRQQEDLSAEGTDHKWSDRFRAKTRLEEKLDEGCTHRRKVPFVVSPDDRHFFQGGIKPRCEPAMVANSDPRLGDEGEGTRWRMSDLDIRRWAQVLACKHVEQHPEQSRSILALTDQAEKSIRSMMADLRFDPESGKVVAGYFLSRDEFYGTFEAHRLTRQLPKKQGPKPVDWEVIRAIS